METRFDVFVWYSHVDARPTGTLLTGRLRDTGRRVAFGLWESGQRERMEELAKHIVVLGRSSATSAWAQRELGHLQPWAPSSGFRLLSVLVGEIERPEALAEWPAVRFRGDGGDADERSLELLLALLRAAPSVSNLPVEPSGAAERNPELDRLLEFFSGPAVDLEVAVITGPSGMGKTTLARYLAHRLRDRFRDGQLFASLGRRSSTTKVLRQLLDVLGLGRPELFSELPEQVEAYHTLTAGRRILVVLDAVSDMEQVTSLAPSGRGSGLVITSRSEPFGFEAPWGAAEVRSTVVEIEPLSEEQALGLLRSEVGDERVRAELPAMQAALRQLDGTPLLVTLLGRQLREHPELPVDVALTELAAERRSSAARRLHASLARVYADVPERDRRLFRLLAVPLDPEVEVGLAAALVSSTADEAEAVLRRLVEAQLVEPSGESRYRVRDLARDLAEERLAEEESEHERQAALRRASRWLAVRGAYEPDARIARDYWTADDTLGYGQYADAIAAFIRHRETRPPLTIGVKAPWGAGKTSLMRMVQERLDPPEDRATWAPTRLRLTSHARGSLADDAAPLAPARPRPRRGGGRSGQIREAKAPVYRPRAAAARHPRAAGEGLNHTVGRQSRRGRRRSSPR